MTPFTPGELEVMKVLWREGALKPAEIEKRLERPISNAALRSVLRILVEKGHVTRRRQGKAYYYRARQPADAAFRRMARRLAELFCQGSVPDLIAHLIRTERLSDDDIRELQRIAAARSESHSDGEKPPLGE